MVTYPCKNCALVILGSETCDGSNKGTKIWFVVTKLNNCANTSVWPLKPRKGN